MALNPLNRTNKSLMWILMHLILQSHRKQHKCTPTTQHTHTQHCVLFISSAHESSSQSHEMHLSWPVHHVDVLVCNLCCTVWPFMSIQETVLMVVVFLRSTFRIACFCWYSNSLCSHSEHKWGPIITTGDIKVPCYYKLQSGIIYASQWGPASSCLGLFCNNDWLTVHYPAYHTATY